MKKLLAIVALGTFMAAPAFAAKQAPYSSQGQHQGAAPVHTSSVDIVQRQQGNNNLNPDFQLSGER